MLFYVIAKLKRNFQPFLAIILFSGLIVALFGALEKACEKKQREFDNICNEIEITCSVTNLTGTKKDNLSLSYWVLELFDMEGDAEFASYLHNVQMKVTRGLGVPYNCGLVGMNSLDMADELYPENGCTIFWNEGYDEGVFASDEEVCLVPEKFGKYENITVRQTSRSDVMAEIVLKVAGTYVGGEGDIYCPWSVMVGLHEALSRQGGGSGAMSNKGAG